VHEGLVESLCVVPSGRRAVVQRGSAIVGCVQAML
jgi:hypothetical protein